MSEKSKSLVHVHVSDIQLYIKRFLRKLYVPKKEREDNIIWQVGHFPVILLAEWGVIGWIEPSAH